MGPAASFAFASRRGAAGGSGGPHSRRKCDISQPGDSLVRRRSDSVSNQPSRMVEKLSVVHPSCKELFDSAIKMHKRACYQQATYNQSWNKVQIIPSEGCVNTGNVCGHDGSFILPVRCAGFRTLPRSRAQFPPPEAKTECVMRVCSAVTADRQKERERARERERWRSLIIPEFNAP